MKIILQKDKISILSSLRKNFPEINFLKLNTEEIKNDILGKDYDLSVVLVGKKKIKFLNKNFRKKDEVTDVLSFSLSSQKGEVFI